MIGLIIYLFAMQFRKRVLQNLVELLTNQSLREIRSYCRTYFYHICITMYEILIDSPTLERTKKENMRV